MSESTVSERIRELIKLEKSSGEFSKKIGQHEGTIRNLLSRDGKPSFNVTASILEVYPKLSPKWFILGDGQMWLEEDKKIIQGNGNNTQVGLGQNIQSINVGEPAQDCITRLSLAEQEVRNLQDKVELLERAVQDKEKIIKMLEGK